MPTATKKPSTSSAKSSSKPLKTSKSSSKPLKTSKSSVNNTKNVKRTTPDNAGVDKNPGQAALDAKLAAKAIAAKAREREAEEQNARWSGKVWRASVAELKVVLTRAEEGGRTPLLLDHTEHKAVDSFYSYQMAQVIEGKKLVMQGRTAEGLAQVMEESRQLLVRAMERGFTLYLRMTNCAADIIKSYKDESSLPVEVWDRQEVAEVVGKNIFEVPDSKLKQVMRTEECDGMDFFPVHKEFRVVVCSHFEEHDYQEFLAHALPLEKMQPIVIT